MSGTQGKRSSRELHQSELLHFCSPQRGHETNRAIRAEFLWVSRASLKAPNCPRSLFPGKRFPQNSDSAGFPATHDCPRQSRWSPSEVTDWRSTSLEVPPLELAPHPASPPETRVFPIVPYTSPQLEQAPQDFLPGLRLAKCLTEYVT